MSIEKLLIPRWKVIADYPKSLYHVGDILNGGCRSEDLIYCDTDGPRWSHYPHLFKKLEWWEERKPEEMPLFIKNKSANPVTYTKVDNWKIIDIENTSLKRLVMVVGDQIKHVIFPFIDPATEDEYLSWANTPTPPFSA